METKTATVTTTRTATDVDATLQSVATAPEYKMFVVSKLEHAGREYKAGESITFTDRDSMVAQVKAGAVSKEAPAASAQ